MIQQPKETFQKTSEGPKLTLMLYCDWLHERLAEELKFSAHNDMSKSEKSPMVSAKEISRKTSSLWKMKNTPSEIIWTNYDLA